MFLRRIRFGLNGLGNLTDLLVLVYLGIKIIFHVIKRNTFLLFMRENNKKFMLLLFKNFSVLFVTKSLRMKS